MATKKVDGTVCWDKLRRWKRLSRGGTGVQARAAKPRCRGPMYDVRAVVGRWRSMVRPSDSWHMLVAECRPM